MACEHEYMQGYRMYINLTHTHTHAHKQTNSMELK